AVGRMALRHPRGGLSSAQVRSRAGLLGPGAPPDPQHVPLPTALKLMRQAHARGPRAGVRLRAVYSAGEPVGEELIAWGREALGVTINEFFGQTEMNLVAGNCAALLAVRPGSFGRPYPGHQVEVLDEEGQPAPPGT